MSDNTISQRLDIRFYDGRFAVDAFKMFEWEVNSILALQGDGFDAPPIALRNQIIEVLFDAYIEQTGETPQGNQVQRLGNWILLEDLTDCRPDKITLTEHPIMTKRQLRTRYHRELANEHIAETLTELQYPKSKKVNKSNFGDV